jgi:hypothetical protein
MNDNLARDGGKTREDLTREELTHEAWAAGVGFERTAARRPALRHRAICWQLIATLTLALSTLLAATVLTLSYAHADTLSLGNNDSASFALALFMGLVLVGMGGLTAIMARPSRD